MGFIPASLSVPADDLSAPRTLADIGSNGGVRAMVVYCASGRRSAQARAALAPRVSTPLFHLDGGVHAWELAGLPICRIPERVTDAPRDVLAYRRRLLACFVGENAEVALDHPTEAQPVEVLRECFLRAGVSWDEPSIEGLYRVLDWAGVATYRAGGDPKHIAENLAEMYGTLQALEKSLVRERP